MKEPRLHLLLRKGLFDEAAALLETKEGREAVDVRDYQGRAPLAVCVNPRVAKLLLEAGAQPDARDLEENTPLHYAANGSEESPDDSVRLAWLLLEAGADINAKNAAGQTPLYSFLYCRNLYFLRELLQRGAEPNPSDAEGRTPLGNYLEEQRSELAEDPQREYEYIEALRELGLEERAR